VCFLLLLLLLLPLLSYSLQSTFVAVDILQPPTSNYLQSAHTCGIMDYGVTSWAKVLWKWAKLMLFANPLDLELTPY
jgi:hypothetical protein